MKNTFGNNLTVTLFGESHGEYIGAVIDGLSPGIEIDSIKIANDLEKRRPYGKISTSRVEPDNYILASGVFEGKTTGTPLAFLIPNENTKSKDYSKTRALARPSHADYTAYQKYHGFEDYRGGGHFSGRLTAGVVGAAAIIRTALEKKGIKIASHIKSIGSVSERGFENIQNDIKILENKRFCVLDDDAGDKMQAEIEAAAKDGDSVGGVIETVVFGMPAGVGEPWFDSLESLLSHAIFSIPAVKGVEFGAGFDITKLRGSEANDSFYIDGGVKTKTNNSGGINGGITNGMPVIMRTAVKPTPTIFKKQDTINFIQNKNAELEMQGRHDPCIVHRAVAVVNAMTAITVADMLVTRFGTDYLGE